MVNNFLETLLTQWYVYQGYFVKNNVNFGKRSNGGYEGEIDVLAYDPINKKLVHIETSNDSKTWEKRVDIINKKFNAASFHYSSILPSVHFNSVDKIAIYSLNQSIDKKYLSNLDKNITVKSIPEVFKEISISLKDKSPRKEAVSETFPLLRAIQFTSNYGYGKS
ncbi:hypothetical protein [Desulfuribacillus alkaliarsenatis]|uniref:DUF4143 domain-containing protein n=1 Tax=Desulfuribacillus alkaliarsenatis TaxID=766136 RepID=A0A1E5G541_9FIRM|nr:hypothetical protein [Desulfuribacillus alkaliarsenatis]OEF98273.1 hypothetical protein BHF68_00900 [Desulfuribacillus alkaliarsenatis]